MTIDEMIYEMEQAFHLANRDGDACNLISDKLRTMEARIQELEAQLDSGGDK